LSADFQHLLLQVRHTPGRLQLFHAQEGIAL
jgi:hypothetical protein